jgi:uncharacterized protein YuzE
MAVSMTDILLNVAKVLPPGYPLPTTPLFIRYDDEADVLYINFKQGIPATDSEITNDDVIERYDGDELIGLTILHARGR